jgi:hypothetical protein
MGSQRHVKCDETHPSCKRCTSTGRECDGCPEPSDAWEVLTLSSISASPSPERRTSAGRYDDKAEASFAFFQLRTVDYLSGLLGREWKPLVLRAADQNDAIYHAALSIGSIHKTVLQKQKLCIHLDEDEYAVQQYTRSLRRLLSGQEAHGSTSVDIILAACILYIGFEVRKLC